MAADPIPVTNPLDPPDKLLTRSAQVGFGAVNTLRIPGDPAADEPARWYKTGGNMPTLRTANNEVKYLVDGPDTFKDMVASIKTASAQGHFIYMLNWWVDDTFALVNNDASTKLSALLQAASDNNVMIRAMFWDQAMPATQNTPEVDHINNLAHGAAVLDDRTMSFGSHHQKVLCVMGEQGLITYCGGIDFNPDRIKSKQELDSSGGSSGGSSSGGGKGTPLHDVHSRVRGPAGVDILQTFIQRWDDHPEGQKHNRPPAQGGKGPLITLDALPSSKGPMYVQVGRTFGRLGSDGYSFAPNGESTARAMILNAINNARRFIYTEDQYFVGNPEVEAALVSALQQKRIAHLTICITHWKLSDLPLVQKHRRDFLGHLRSAGGDRLRVFTLQPPKESEQKFEDGLVPHTYIHAKIWVMDDEFAVIGSVNTNHRSWSHDSEIASGIYDASNDRILTYRMAHWLRIKIWAEHLGMQTPEGEAELADGVASAAQWLFPPNTARIQRYNIDDTGDIHLPGPLRLIEDSIYDSVIDPA